VLDTQYFGVAQRRPRLFIVGLNRERYPEGSFLFPEPPLLVKPRTVEMELKGLPEPVFFQRGLTPAEIPYHPNHWTMLPRSSKFRDPNQRLNWSRGRSFRVLRWDAPSWTVAYGHREVHVHPGGHRRLSVYEAMRLQGFPSSYVLEGTLSNQFRLVGDAVPPPLARALAVALDAFISSSPHVENSRLPHRPSSPQLHAIQGTLRDEGVSAKGGSLGA
jgi:DNA (cytosine-5)-methyltransferase 1